MRVAFVGRNSPRVHFFSTEETEICVVGHVCVRPFATSRLDIGYLTGGRSEDCATTFGHATFDLTGVRLEDMRRATDIDIKRVLDWRTYDCLTCDFQAYDLDLTGIRFKDMRGATLIYYLPLEMDFHIQL
jgi:hypothetical protein